MENYLVKNYSATYMYMKGDYERPLMSTIMNCIRIDKESPEFETIISDVKRRQESTVLVDVLMSPDVVLMINNKSVPDAFSVFTAKDITTSEKKMKVFVDCTNIIELKNGFYDCKRIDVLIAYLMSAMNHKIYYTDCRRILTNSNLCTDATDCFVSMFFYILDYLRLAGVSQNKEKLYYMIAMYFQTSVLMKPISDTTRNTAAKIAGITAREASVIDILYDEERDFKNIKTFIDRLTAIYSFKGFTVDVFIERWRYLFGRGTQFGAELYPAFATILTNAYSGTYLVNQKTIEKVCGRNMVTFTTTLLSVGFDSLKR